MLPVTTRLFAELADSHPGVPTILFGVGTGELLASMATAGSTVIGVDWRVPLDEARRRVGPGLAVQGNLDPAMCLTTWEVAAAETREVLARAGDAPGHIFNLGHGVLPETDPEILGEGHRARPCRRAGRGGAALMSPALSPPVGVLVMAHGTPATPAGIAPFYTAIRRGRPPPPELLDELVGRYQAIGGTSPLTERTQAQVDGIAAALDAADPGRYLVAYGTKYATPSIEEGMATLVAAGVERVIGIVLTPHQSSLGSGEYLRRAAEAAASGARPVALTTVPSWHRAPGFSQLLAERTAATLASIDAGAQRVDLGVLHRPQPPAASGG